MKVEIEKIEPRFDFILGIPYKDCGYISDVPCTSEEEVVAMAAGMKIAGGEPMVFMQNSGLGRCIDVITSLLIPYDIKIDIKIHNRKEPEHHRKMGEITEDIIRLLDYDTIECD